VIILKAQERITAGDAMSFLIDLALYSNYIPLDGPAPGSVSEVAAYLERRGKSIPKCAAEMMLYREKPRYFYNLIGPTWHTKGVKVSRVGPSGEERQIIDGDGQYHTANYWAKFEQSLADFERAIAESNHELLLSAFAKGQAAIENFLNVLPIAGIKDSSVENKLEKIWTADAKRGAWDVARTKEPWSSFLEMKRIRNKQEIHNKDDASGFTYQQIHEHFNLYARAIPKTLFELHKMSRQRCPASIIRASYYPAITMERAPEPDAHANRQGAAA
jgi:hypothetical protein